MAICRGDFGTHLGQNFQSGRSVKFQVVLARTKANLMQHKKCLNLRKYAFLGVKTTKKLAFRHFQSHFIILKPKFDSFSSRENKGHFK